MAKCGNFRHLRLEELQGSEPPVEMACVFRVTLRKVLCTFVYARPAGVHPPDLRPFCDACGYEGGANRQLLLPVGGGAISSLGGLDCFWKGKGTAGSSLEQGRVAECGRIQHHRKEERPLGIRSKVHPSNHHYPGEVVLDRIHQARDVIAVLR